MLISKVVSFTRVFRYTVYNIPLVVVAELFKYEIHKLEATKHHRRQQVMTGETGDAS